MKARFEQLLAGADRRDRAILATAMALSFALVIVYVLATMPNGLAGDQLEYHREGVLFTEGKLWWATAPFGVAHPSAWKTPIYPAWVGLWYEILGAKPALVGAVQALLAPLSVLLTWVLAKRLFDPRTALLAACVVAVFPLAWEFYGLLYSEALAVPLTLGVLLLFLGRGAPSRARAAGVGAAIGIALLVRPSSGFLFTAALAAWVIAAGWKRGLSATAIAVVVALVVVAPWTIRNSLTDGIGFVPLSVQDGAAYGTFNSTSANDPLYPYAWRPVIDDQPAVLTGPPVSDSRLRSGLQDSARDYIADHPFSAAEAFFWNGLSRLWDVRRPGRALDEVPFEGRSQAVTAVGLGMYYVLLVCALAGLWRHRRRRDFVIPVLALALAASVVFTSASGTRYRAPLEPLIVICAASLLAPVRAIRASSSAQATARPSQAATASGV